MLYSVFNATGNTPYYPAGTNKADFLFSVFNATGNTPYYPPGTNDADFVFSVFNATGNMPYYPAGSNYTDYLFSVFNATGAHRFIRLVPTSRGSYSPSRTRPEREQVRCLFPFRRPGGPLIWGPDWETNSRRPAARELIAGQSVEIAIQPSLFLHYLELDADRTALASSTTGSLSLPLTAPFGVDSFALRAFGYTSYGATSDSLVETVRVMADPGRTITGTCY